MIGVTVSDVSVAHTKEVSTPHVRLFGLKRKLNLRRTPSSILPVKVPDHADPGNL
jgi:hypothetical protein